MFIKFFNKILKSIEIILIFILLIYLFLRNQTDIKTVKKVINKLYFLFR